MKTDTPRTYAAMIERARINSDSVGFEFVTTVEFAERLERELNEALKWKEEDPRMLREQIRVADLAYNELHRQLLDANKTLSHTLAMLEQTLEATPP